MIYLDYNATTPILPEVRDAMLPALEEHWGNPSGAYPFSKEAENTVEVARSHVARLIDTRPENIVFTSCATESNQTILHGCTGRIATSSVEHSSIHDFLKERDGNSIVPVDLNGRLDLSKLDTILSHGQTKLVSVIWANNETGVISPIQEIARLCKKHDVLFHSDAVQAVGKIDISVERINVDYLSLSAHKIYGPKGIGALYVRDGAPYKPLLVGSQENGRRGGTESVPLIAGLGKAAELARQELNVRTIQVKKMRDLLEHSILQQISDTSVNGDKNNRLPNTTNIRFKNIDSDMLVQLMGSNGIMAANGSACKSSAITPSHVLIAMGRKYNEADEAIRFSLSHLTNESNVHATIDAIKNIIKEIR